MTTKRTRKTEEELANGVKRLRVKEVAKEAKQNDTVAKSPAKKEAAKKDAVTKSPAKKEMKKKDAVAKLPAKKDAVAKSPAKKDTVIKPPAKKEAAKKPAPKKTAPKKEPTPAPFLKARTAAAMEVPRLPSSSGSVLVFGNGDCGQLGLGEDMIERKKPFPVAALGGAAVVDVACGGLHTMALTAEGVLWSWGCNDQQALGRGGDEFVAAAVEGLEGVRVVRVACSDSATFAVGADGRVYAWGTFRSSEGIMGFGGGVSVQARPALVAELREPIVDVSAGADHVLALSSSARVYAWGCGQQGQLGRLVLERRRLHGLRPERLRLHDVRAIGCGSYHSFAVTRAGAVYAWGLNNFRQLGLADADGADQEIIHEPTLVRALDGAAVARIAGGEHHSLALAADGRLFAFGRSDSHQTGLPFATLPSGAEPRAGESQHKKAITAPTHIASLPRVADFACGSNHNVALDADGRAFTWGYGEMLQLGNGEEEDVAEPALLQGQKIDGRRVLKVGAGGQHSVVVAAEAS
ncbi:hypothetical protein GGI04_000767 [Coemansia thaxteri]|uniref:RCC1-like domain-containing protein n=1 Tax=Coemansia thaxteri TaxID=2663907 RepID=A0A9W8BCX5_9FUNG|nr:hypothetical protein H4R26_002425 [Coemansia thaxteri]KAJ2009037.1 hypothetical protein GGI04_000767 [Coemansia thaxteri]KAJ2473471.1 hypothetical protein GGI02_000838 [Coemansia sp. RSA 2322]KAJ2477580.1 hypothetical protein EV174_004580 [Coemansia sp. RSA 2320]